MSSTRLIITEKGRLLQKELLNDLAYDDIPQYKSYKNLTIKTNEHQFENYDNYYKTQISFLTDRSGYFRPKDDINDLLTSVRHNNSNTIYPLYLRKEDNYPTKHVCTFKEKSTTVTEKMKTQKPIFKTTHHTKFKSALASTGSIPHIIISDYTNGLDGTNILTNDISFINTPASTQRHTEKNIVSMISSIKTPRNEQGLDSNLANIKILDGNETNFLPKLAIQTNINDKTINQANLALMANQSVGFDSKRTKTSFKSSKYRTLSHNTMRSENSLSLSRMAHHYDPVKLSRIIEKAEQVKQQFGERLDKIDKKLSTNNVKMNDFHKVKEYLDQFKQNHNMIEMHENEKILEKNHYKKKIKDLQYKKYEATWKKFNLPNKFNQNNVENEEYYPSTSSNIA